MSWLLILMSAATPLDLEWTAPDSCPRRQDVLQRVAELVGSDYAGPARLRASAVVRTEPWQVVLSVRSASGTSRRELDARTCAGLAEAVAVILALALDEAPVLRTPLRPVRSTWSDPAGAGLGWGFEASVRAGAGHLPGLALGTSLRASLGTDRLMGGLGATFWLPTVATSELDVRARLRLYVAEAWFGRRISAGPLEITPQVAVEVGRLETEGFGAALEEGFSASALHVSGGAGTSLGIGLVGPLWLRGEALVHLGLARPNVRLEEGRRLFRSELVTARWALGLELRGD